MRLSIDEWDELVGRHLHAIEAGSEMIESHAKQLFGLPDFELRAMERLDHAEKLLGVALTRIAQARQAMERKQRVS